MVDEVRTVSTSLLRLKRLIQLAAFILFLNSCSERDLSVYRAPQLDEAGPTAFGRVHEYRIAKCPNSYCQPSGVTLGPDGEVWFANYLYEQPGEIDSAGQFKQFTLSGGNGYLFGIATGLDGNLWMTSPSVDPSKVPSQIVRMTPAGEPTFFDIPGTSSQPIGITAGPDGNMWFADEGASQIGRITLDGNLTTFPLSGHSHPIEITSGPDGNLWFTDEYLVSLGFDSKIGKITTAGVLVAEYLVRRGH